MIINTPLIDWITFTTFSETDFLRFERFQKCMAGEIRAGQIRMYAGQWIGSTFLGQGYQNEKNHVMFRCSGSDSHDLFLKLSPYLNTVNCSRIDLQITIDLPADYWARGLVDDLRTGQSGEYTRQVTLVESEKGLNTIYIGSRQSERFCRLYVKNINDVNYLRLEVEYKGAAAKAIKIILADNPGLIGAYLQDFINSIGCHDRQGIFELFGAVLDAPGKGLHLEYTVADINKTLAWIINQVTPTMVRLLNDHDTSDILRSHLTNMLNNLDR